MSLPLAAGARARRGWAREITQMTVGALKEVRVGIGWTVAVAIIGAAAGGGGAWAGLQGRLSLQQVQIEQLRSDLALRDAFQAEMRTLRDSIESKAHQEASSANRSQEIDLQSIKLALARKGIHVEN